jgi:L-Lysine epsilon oxidase N-terminal/L-lysine epsilon oxidase C-terminal domain
MALPPIYKIHPAIGVARLGDAASFFIGPETPGLRPIGDPPGTKVPPYKDGGRIKPQAARFRIFEYRDNGSGAYMVGQEVTLTDKDVKIVWTVRLANRKASFFTFGGMAGEDRAQLRRRNDGFRSDRRKLEIDPGQRSVSGKSAKPQSFTKGTSKNPARESWPDPSPVPAITTLGSILTDADGRLLVLGGRGDSGSQPGSAAIATYANNDGWFDDVSDGPVTAQLLIKGKAVTVVPAWVVCPPPDFAPQLTSVVTLYDLLFDVAARSLTLPTNEAAYLSGGARANLGKIAADFRKAGKAELSSYLPDWLDEVYPILYRAAASMFLAKQAVGQHGTLIRWAALSSNAAKDQAARQGVLAWVRTPDAKPTDTFPYMPKLLGDEPYPLTGGVSHQHVRLTVTPTQFAILKQWVAGKFVPPPPGTFLPPPPPASTITPEGLDRAALDGCVGGAFFPGIEVGWQIRNPALFLEPFRIKHGAPTTYRGDSGALRAGHFTRQMALPWQADFLQCKTEDGTGPFLGMAGWGWWPAQRPDFVFPTETSFKAKPPAPVAWHRATKGGLATAWATGFPTRGGGRDTSTPSYDEMLANWRKFGFVVESVPFLFLETEREKDVP